MDKILIASDHAGFELKEKLKTYLENLGYEIKDFGANELNSNDDFTDFIIPLAKEISKDSTLKGIILGGSGQGEAMLANKFKGVRAVVYYGDSINKQKDSAGNELDIISSTRIHNDANVLSLGARFINEDDAKNAVRDWLQTSFSNEERHVRRIEKINEIGE